MSLEATVLCLDNSEWMRNGDYVPTRLESQHDAANLLCGTKTQSNPESTVGVLTMAGHGVEVLASPTGDIGKLLTALHNIPIGGRSRFADGIQVAQLALKHRRNKHGGQRVIVFVGSPIEEDERSLVKIGKNLKKNNVAADVVSFGEIDENQTKLEAFIGAVDSDSNSHLVTVPVGVLPSDVLISSPIVHGGQGPSESGGGGADFAEYGGIDPSMDPELALALRVSMEEEKARQEAAAKKEQEEKAKQTGDVAVKTEGGEGDKASGAAAASTAAQTGEEDEDDLLNKALAMSMGQQQAGATGATEEDDEDEAMRIALQMSMQENAEQGQNKRKAPASAVGRSSAASSSEMEVEEAPSPAAGPTPATSGGPSSAPFLDPSFVSSLLSGLPGVDPNDPKIQEAMAKITGKGSDKEDKKDNEEDKKE